METRFSNKFELFEKEGLGSVRTMISENGDIWFVATDICTILGIKHAPTAYSRLEPEEKATVVSNNSGGNNGKNSIPVKRVVVSESGMYSLIMGSKKAEAKAFQRWVTNEVLPSIRKNGGYIYGQEDLEAKDRARLEATIQELTARNAKLQNRRHELISENKELKVLKKHNKKELAARNDLLDTYEEMINRYYSDYEELLRKNKSLKKEVERLKNPITTEVKVIEPTKYYYDIFGNRYNTLAEAKAAAVSV